MPDGWNGWLLLLGQLLPTRLRDLVFKPACYDLVHETLEKRRDPRWIPPRLIGILLHVAVANFPRVLFEGRRPSRLAFLLGGLGVGVLLLLLTLVLAMRGAYS